MVVIVVWWGLGGDDNPSVGGRLDGNGNADNSGSACHDRQALVSEFSAKMCQGRSQTQHCKENYQRRIHRSTLYCSEHGGGHVIPKDPKMFDGFFNLKEEQVKKEQVCEDVACTWQSLNVIVFIYHSACSKKISQPSRQCACRKKWFMIWKNAYLRRAQKICNSPTRSTSKHPRIDHYKFLFCNLQYFLFYNI